MNDKLDKTGAMPFLYIDENTKPIDVPTSDNIKACEIAAKEGRNAITVNELPHPDSANGAAYALGLKIAAMGSPYPTDCIIFNIEFKRASISGTDYERPKTNAQLISDICTKLGVQLNASDAEDHNNANAALSNANRQLSTLCDNDKLISMLFDTGFIDLMHDKIFIRERAISADLEKLIMSELLNIGKLTREQSVDAIIATDPELRFVKNTNNNYGGGHMRVKGFCKIYPHNLPHQISPPLLSDIRDYIIKGLVYLDKPIDYVHLFDTKTGKIKTVTK